MSKRVVVDAPAKINLGLEVLGKRDDGFHEIRSVFHGIDLADRLSFSLGSASPVDAAGIPIAENLVSKAIQLWSAETGQDLTPGWELEKRIPLAAGLGGGSSDAAATLRALELLSDSSPPRAQLMGMAARLGSDVPFFLGELAAKVGGRGEEITAITGLDEGWAAVLIHPDVVIPNKTGRLYGLLTPDDFSDGSKTASLVETLAHGQPPGLEHLGNVFSRALYELMPDLVGIPTALDQHGIELHGISGAGPTHYALVRETDLQSVATQLRQTFPATIQVIPVKFRREPIAARWAS